LGQENVDYWFGSDADDEVVCEVVAEENIAEKGNNEPFRVDDPIVVGASLLYQEDDDWLGSDADDEVLRKQVTEENEAEMRHSGTIELTNDGDNPFIDAFFTSIEKARNMIAGQWRECTWDKKVLDIQDPTTNVEVIGLSTHTFVYTIYLPLLSILYIQFVCIDGDDVGSFEEDEPLTSTYTTRQEEIRVISRPFVGVEKSH
jgi:hypothetical protein